MQSRNARWSIRAPGSRARVLPGLFAVFLLASLAGCDGAGGSDRPEAPVEPAAAVPLENHFVGSDRCGTCHSREMEAWRGSDHDRAIEVANDDSVLGVFDGAVLRRPREVWTFLRDGDEYVVELDRVDAPKQTLAVSHTFGVDPLQQYLVERSDGRRQALPIAWDSRPVEEGGQRWIDLQPGADVPPEDPLHWERLAYNWNSQCASCHSTHLAKGYDEEAGVFDTRWAEIDVGCEACHGPGSGHVALRDPAIEAAPGIVDLEVAFDRWDPESWQRAPATRVASRVQARERDAQLDVCAPCHSRRAQIVPTPKIGTPFLDGHRPSLIEPELYFADGQIRDEVYVWGSFLQSRMHTVGVRCNDCHEPHSLALRREGNALCTGCHDPTSYDAPIHHGHGSEESPALGAGAGVEARDEGCVDCHMPERVYMEVDARRDHSFPVPRPARSAILGTPDVCTACHADRDATWAAQAIESWGGAGRLAKPHWSERLVEGDSMRTDAKRWLEIAREPDFPSIVRASAWSAYAREADAAEVAANWPLLRESLRTASELERLALIDVGQSLAPASRVSLLRPLLKDDHAAIRARAAEALASVPAESWGTGDRAVLARALREYRAQLLANAERPEAQVGLGTLSVHYGEPDEARAAYRRALALAPYFVPAYVNLADLERMLGRDAESVDWLRQAVELVPDDAWVRYAYGLALYRTGQREAGLAELERAAKQAPAEPRLVLARALALDAVGRRDEAVDVLATAIERGPRSGDLRHALVTMLRDRGEIDRARRSAEAWLEASPEDPRPRALLEELASPR